MDDFDQKYFLYQTLTYDFSKLSHFAYLDFGNRGIWDKASILADWLNGLAGEQIPGSKLLESEQPHFVALGEVSHTIYCVFNGDWGYSPTSRFGRNP